MQGTAVSITPWQSLFCLLLHHIRSIFPAGSFWEQFPFL